MKVLLYSGTCLGFCLLDGLFVTRSARLFEVTV